MLGDRPAVARLELTALEDFERNLPGRNAHIADTALDTQRAGRQVADEASAIESLGFKPLLVPNGTQNFKVTYPGDFVLAEAVLKARLR